MVVGCSVGGVMFNEVEIIGVELKKNVEKLSRVEVERWLKCCGCRNLSEFIFNGLKFK